MRVLVPFDAREPNTRLTPFFTADQRREFAAVLRGDVVDAIRAAGHEPELLSTGAIDADCPVRIDERPLSTAVNAALTELSPPAGILMADLGLVTPAAVSRLLDSAGDVVLAPGLGGGTNGLCVRDPAFRVDYHDGSYRKHTARARDCGATVTTVDSFRLALDVDEPDDLAEVLLHGQGDAPTWLAEHGIEIAPGDRCTVRNRNDGNGAQ